MTQSIVGGVDDRLLRAAKSAEAAQAVARTAIQMRSLRRGRFTPTITVGTYSTKQFSESAHPMGFSISWIAVSGKPKADILQSLSLADTAEPDDAHESPVSGAELPGGWYILFLNDMVHPFTAAAHLQRLSAGCKVLSCQVEEHVMASAACMYENGVQAWSVTHASENGAFDLAVEGAAPPSLEAIHAEMKAMQDEEGGDEADVDYIFDVPVSLAAAICGYRHDFAYLTSGEEPSFTELVPMHG